MKNKFKFKSISVSRPNTLSYYYVVYEIESRFDFTGRQTDMQNVSQLKSCKHQNIQNTNVHSFQSGLKPWSHQS